MTTDADQIRQATEANQALGVAGHSDMVWGHASVRDVNGRGIWMKASGWAFEEITDDRVLLVSPDGEVLAGEGKRHIEYPIHTRVMAVRPDVGAVVHSHAASAVAFASLDRPLRPVSHDAVSFVDPDVPRFTRSGALITDADMGDALADTLGDSAGLLIPGHGLVTVGASPGQAVMRAVLLNRACATQLLTEQAGGPVRWSDDEEVLVKRDTVAHPSQLEIGYQYLVRRARAGSFPVTPI
ncbi:MULTISPECIES: class II aldolase/adducin family protein [unclassified Modestobacter]